MTHYMNLSPSPFSKIADGSKTSELRLNDEKRQKINIGDMIVFRCTKNGDCITAKVKGLHKFPSFEELSKALPLNLCGYSQSELETAHYTDMEEYYSQEKIPKYGALGIEITLDS